MKNNVKTLAAVITYSLKLFLSFCVALSLTSCGSDDSESGDSQSQLKQDSSTWYMYDDNLSSYVSQIKRDYNEDILNFYNYVAEDGSLQHAGSRYAIQIINKNTLKIWYFSYGVAGCIPSLDSEYYIPTNYSIGADKIISYSTSSAMYTYASSDGKIIIPSIGEIYTVTSQGLVGEGSSTALKKTNVYVANTKEEKLIIKDCKNKENTVLTTECDFENFICHVTFRSSLGNLHPNGAFMYGIEYGLRNGSFNIFETDKSSFDGNTRITGYDEIFMQMWKNIDEKIKNGEQLSENTMTLYKSLTKRIEDARAKAKQDFIVKSYVRYGGVKYYN